MIGSLYPTEAPMLHFNMFRCAPVPGVDPHSLTQAERNALQRSNEFKETGRGYNEIQTTKVIPSVLSAPMINETLYA